MRLVISSVAQQFSPNWMPSMAIGALSLIKRAAICAHSRAHTGSTESAGKYYFLRLPFGSSDSKGTFQKKMDDVIHEASSGALRTADDICVFGHNVEEYDDPLHRLMHVATKQGLAFRPEKCHIKKDQITFYGLNWSKERMKLDESRCNNTHNRPPHQMYLSCKVSLVLSNICLLSFPTCQGRPICCISC